MNLLAKSQKNRLTDYAALVVGSGSIGRRHMRNLRSLGIRRLAVCDPAAERMTPMIKDLGVEAFTDFMEGMDTVAPDLVFVCSPPIFHIPQARYAVEAGAHVFVEKPLSHSLEGVDELISEADARQVIVQVGYNLRFHPGLCLVKKLLDESAVGRILWASAETGQYLPDWRPWQDYRQSYTAREDLGGGIVLDASHELDYVVWLLGHPTELVCMAGKVSDLQVNVEDCATVLLRFPSGAQVDVHMDFVQRGYARSCKLTGEKGTILWDYVAHHVRIYDGERDSWETRVYEFNTNEMYLAEVRHFLDCVSESVTPLVDLEQAKKVLQIVMAAKSSAMNGRLEVIT